MGSYLRTKRSTKKQSSIASLLIMVAVVFVCLVVVFKVSDLHAKSKELAVAEQSLEQKIEEANQERENLVAKEQYMKTDDYIEDVAKEKLGLVYPDEIVIRPAE
ncbi:MAG: septum formation initiator family protein [Lachnospiraceae bacterium]|nr:septum formation initiator family protein [Lachnospiraceae bacterium]